MKGIITVLIFLLPIVIFAGGPKVKTGADILFERYLDLLKGKNVGLVTNHTALLSNGQHIADALFENKSIKLVALFGPEHGVRGDTTGAVNDATDRKTGLPAYSLYGKTYKPTSEMLKGIDILVFDIQDVGARFYTYISTLGFVMEAAAENSIPIVVLDRPNPITGLYLDGFVTGDTMKSFVAYGKIPTAYGMTIGELAELYNGEGMLHNGKKADLRVIKMEGWERKMWYDETGLKWIRTSPNLPLLETAIVYSGTCFFEGVNISEGRGTDKPFQYIGAPWINSEKAAKILNDKKIKGVDFVPVEFTPDFKANNARPPKYYKQLCKGIYLNVTDRNSFEPVKAAVYLLWTFKQTNADSMQWRKQTIDRLAATPKLREMLDEGKTPEEIFSAWNKELVEFKNVRQKYLLYK